MPDFHVSKDFKIRQNSHSGKTNRSKKSQAHNSHFMLAKYSSLGYYLVTPLILGVFVGLVADNYFNTKPAFVIFGLLFGAVSTGYNMHRMVKDEAQQNAYKHKTRDGV